MSRKNGSILALDLGTRHVGVAIYQPLVGVELLDGFSFRDQYHFQNQIRKYLGEFPVGLVLVGDMGQTQIPKWMNDFLEQIAESHQIELKIQPEYLTTFQSEAELNLQTGGIDDRRSHSQAAAHLLRDYLEAR